MMSMGKWAIKDDSLNKSTQLAAKGKHAIQVPSSIKNFNLGDCIKFI